MTCEIWNWKRVRAKNARCVQFEMQGQGFTLNQNIQNPVLKFGWCKTQVQVQFGYFIVKNSFRRVEELLSFCGDLWVYWNIVLIQLWIWRFTTFSSNEHYHTTIISAQKWEKDIGSVWKYISQKLLEETQSCLVSLESKFCLKFN